MNVLEKPIAKKMANLSPRRQALADHQRRQAAAAAAVDAARILFQKTQARIEAAQAVLRTAESARHSLIESEAEGIRQSCGQDDAPDLSLQLAAADAEIARAERVIAALECELVTLEAPFRSANLAANVLDSATEKLVAEILHDEAGAAISQMAEAWVVAARAEARARSAIESVAGKRWFVTAERLNTAFSQAPRPAWDELAHGPAIWDRFTDALALDAGAEAPSAGHA